MRFLKRLYYKAQIKRIKWLKSELTLSFNVGAYPYTWYMQEILELERELADLKNKLKNT